MAVYVSAPENTAAPLLEANGEQCQSGQERSLSSKEIYRAALKNLEQMLVRGARERKLYLDKAHWRGESARGRYMRVSPYYEDPGADVFWYAGFDGLSLEEAAVLHDAAIGRTA
jgi:hypothetical protein